jgi:hypothetical protein
MEMNTPDNGPGFCRFEEVTYLCQPFYESNRLFQTIPGQDPDVI